jgi:hypothetical protein
MNISTTGWNAFLAAQPIDPLSIIASVNLGASAGTYKRSTTFLQPSWGTNTVGFTGNNSNMTSLNTTDASTIAWAAQWLI